MSWSTFHFICRSITQQLNQGETTGDAVVKAKALANALELPPLGSPKSLPAQILSEISSQPRQAALQSATAYGEMDLEPKLSAPPTLLRLHVYMSLLLICYGVMASLFSTFVYPQFAIMFEQMDVGMPGQMGWFIDYNDLISIAIFLLIVFNLTASLQIRQMFRFTLPITENQSSWLLLIPSRSKRRYQQLKQLIETPIHQANEKQVPAKQIELLASAGLNPKTELTTLIAHSGKQLTIELNHYSQGLLAITAIAIIATIVMFLVSAYSPIFVLGDVV
ncbi:hypothetical protein ACFSJ3_14990 [Corallincola platygyrae]|uniref:Uncharacterized protein n=1 Tax=Corallincola platygyrae TaxID=1193278 RepID=A0ABW4XS16_9GAMM